MKGFHFVCPGEVFFGENCILENTHVFARCGKKALIITSEFPENVVNKALEDVKVCLAKEGIGFEIDDGVMCDPTVEYAVSLKERLMACGADFIVAAGGGSVLDVAKCANMLLKAPEADPYVLLYGKGPRKFETGQPSEGKLPLITIPTTAGTGSELTGTAVMTRKDTDNKGGTNRRGYANYAFIDARYIHSAPLMLNHATAIDALCHGIEIYISEGSRDDFMACMLIEKALSLFAQFKDNLLSGTMTAEDYELQTLHSFLQGLVITNEFTGVPHGMGYPLSHFYDIPHGLACGIFEGEYLRSFKDTSRVDKVISLMGFSGIEEFCDYIQAILAPHIQLSVTMEEIEKWTDVFCAQHWRMERHPEPISREDIRGIYLRSLARFIIK